VGLLGAGAKGVYHLASTGCARRHDFAREVVTAASQDVDGHSAQHARLRPSARSSTTTSAERLHSVSHKKWGILGCLPAAVCDQG